MKVKCAVINDLLPLYVDDVLSQESRELVEEHIKECEACRKTLENMTGKISIPVNKELRMDETKSLKGLKKIVTRYKGLAIAFAIIAVIGIMFSTVLIMCRISYDIPYDGSNITFDEHDDGYYIHYHGTGGIAYSANGTGVDGEWEISFSQTAFDKIIRPFYRHDDDVIKFGFEKASITKLSTRDGVVIWEANEEQMKAHEEWLKEREA